MNSLTRLNEKIIKSKELSIILCIYKKKTKKATDIYNYT